MHTDIKVQYERHFNISVFESEIMPLPEVSIKLGNKKATNVNMNSKYLFHILTFKYNHITLYTLSE